ncbi:hypothetical protein EJ04DRAFT_576281 [Polyplosphaeria fusca]|uniref:Rhodopsin domain-containing protein n=1 Tax=Polyplosphaeria fusca TaxID=682080 RepID=A0A9P4V3C4_9PLEO|nr:hypothetical protein EJ04DRAFT_576281 [Polyplosphaeria fusca]
MYAITSGRQKTLIAAPTVFTFLAICFTCLRILSRRIKKAGIRVDDWLCIIATCMCTGLLGANIAMVVGYGGGNSISEMKSQSDFLIWYKLIFATYLVWVVNIAIVQMAILLYYQRLFFVIQWFSRLCYAVMGLVCAWAVGCWVANFAMCHPTARIWDPMVAGTCGNSKAMCVSADLLHAALDAGILCMPLPIVWRMGISTGKKLGLTVLLLAGTFATVSSILRMECLFKLTGTHAPTDLSLFMWLPLVYYFVELPIAICCCSAPALPPLFREAMASKFGQALKARLNICGKRDHVTQSKDQGRTVQELQIEYGSSKAKSESSGGSFETVAHQGRDEADA